MSADAAESLIRAFVTVGDRQVHYRRMGKGPPALFIHSSPTNSSFVLTDMAAQADRYTCYAFDTPGFGLSDPLPAAELTVRDLADATAAALAALRLPPLPVFGTHTGAAIALELGYRHPDRVTGLVLDGVPIFTREEVAGLGDAYFAQLVPDPLGGHYSAVWTRFRDQYRWFPWYARSPDAINDVDLGDAQAVHGWTEMFFAAAAHYRSTYRAAIGYCEGAIEAAAGLRVPAIFTAAATDMLHPHLQRLPLLRADQEIAEIGTDPGGKKRLTRKGFERFGSSGPIRAALNPEIEPAGAIRRQFVMDSGRPVLVRYAGRPGSTALLLLHDAPGSSRMVEDRIAELAEDFLVIAPDIPGSGDSEGLPEEAELPDYAAALWRACDTLSIGPVRLEGHGLGASLALEMTVSAPERVLAIQVDGVPLPDEAERASLLARYAPEIRIEPDGAHWYRLWLRLRDSLVYWPWFDTRATAVRRVAESLDAERLHGWTIETMKQCRSAHRFPRAALRYDAGVALRRLPKPPMLLPIHPTPVAAAYRERLRAYLEGFAP